MHHQSRMPAFVAGAAFLALALASCAKPGAPAAESDPRPVVVVSVQPQAYFVERVSGGSVRPLVLVGPGQSPHAYEPTPRQLSELKDAVLWFTVGAEFEKALVPRITALYPRLTLSDTTVGVVYRMLEEHAHEGDDPGEAEESGPDQHIWLGRGQSKAQAAVMRDALSALDPARAGVYEANYRAFAADVDAAFDGLASRLAPWRGRAAFVYHPAFGYFLDEFGIRQEAVETGGKEPTAKALAALVEEARRDGATAIFVQAQFPSSAARAVAEAIGGRVVSIDPLAADWLDNLKRMGDALAEAAP